MLFHAIMFFCSKIWHYSPSDTSKQYEKNAGKKSTRMFQPQKFILKMKEERKTIPMAMTEEDRRKIVKDYLSVSSKLDWFRATN